MGFLAFQAGVICIIGFHENSAQGEAKKHKRESRVKIHNLLNKLYFLEKYYNAFRYESAFFVISHLQAKQQECYCCALPDDLFSVSRKIEYLSPGDQAGLAKTTADQTKLKNGRRWKQISRLFRIRFFHYCQSFNQGFEQVRIFLKAAFVPESIKVLLLFSNELMEIADDMEVFSQFYDRMVNHSEQKDEFQCSSLQPSTSYELERERSRLLDHLKVKMCLIDESKFLSLLGSVVSFSLSNAHRDRRYINGLIKYKQTGLSKVQ